MIVIDHLKKCLNEYFFFFFHFFIKGVPILCALSFSFSLLPSPVFGHSQTEKTTQVLNACDGWWWLLVEPFFVVFLNLN